MSTEEASAEAPRIRKHSLYGYRQGCRCDICRAAKREDGQRQRRKRIKAIEDGSAVFAHGLTGYTSWGCRCEVCKAAKADHQSGMKGYQKEYRSGRKAALEKGEAEFKHGLGGYSNYGCRCEVCSESYKVWRSDNPGKRYHVTHPEEEAAAARRKVADWQRQTLEGATRYGYQWTGPELEVAARPDLTAREAALLIGRTYASVKNVRKKLKTDPKTINVAGIPRGSAGPVRPDEEPTT